MSATRKAKSESSATPATYLKGQGELLETQNQRIVRLLDNVDTFQRILGNVRQWRIYEQDQELVHAMEDAIKETKHQIAEIRKQQRVQFEAYLAVSETMSESDMSTIYEEEEEVSRKVEGMFGKGKKREEHGPYTEVAHQLTLNRTKTSHDADQTSQMDEEQSDRQYGEADMVPVPHKRVKALRSASSLARRASRVAKPSATQSPLQQQPWSVDELQEQSAPQAYRNTWMSVAVINEVLRRNVEKQGIVLAGLKKSKEEIQKLQEKIERDGDLEEWMLQQWNLNVETFLREREVMDWPGGEEDE